MLDFHLRNVDGRPAGASVSPVVTGSDQNQTYGRYSARFRVDNPALSEYYVAWLLWPQSERWPVDGEFDFPEGSLAGPPGGFHHYSGAGSCVGGCQAVAADIGASFNDWHTYTMEWSPGRIRYLLDDVVVLDSSDWVPSTPMRWELQTETKGNGNSDGHLLLDWVSVWAWNA
ncbi:MAG: glycoside hydrolase family 16 protein [Rhodococcus sp. (in: high G+C Gram-positive bacteria)]